MRVSKLHKRIVVDASDSSHPYTADSNRSCSPSFAASEPSLRTDSDASTSTTTPPTTTTTSSSESPVPVELLFKKFRRRGSPSKPIVKVECIDVDDASSSAPPATLVRESDYYPTDYVNG